MAHALVRTVFAPPPTTNALVALVPDRVRAALEAHGTVRRLRRGASLFPPETRWDAAYFPYDAVVAVLALLREGGEVEVEAMGREGLLGLHVAFDVQPLRGEAICQLGGAALAVPGPALRAIVAESPELRHLLLRYALARLSVLGQSSACRAVHSTAERCARWLLCSQDRTGRAEFDVTQEFLARMLGVRRATVTAALAALQQAGALRVGRGWIAVRDRASLERATCECYAVVRGEFAALFA